MTTKSKTAEKAPEKAAEKTVAVKLPSVGQIVSYRVPDAVADDANALRSTVAQSHCGAKIKAGDVFPMIVTKVNEKTFNGQVLLDGNDSHWVKGAAFGDSEGDCF